MVFEKSLAVGQSALGHRSNLVPVVVMVGLSALLLIAGTEPIGEWLLEENHPVELVSFAAALAAAIVSFLLGREYLARNRLAGGFFLVFGAAMFFLAMEEISWGQQFLGFSTPEPWRVRNSQDELTLHNYDFVGVDFLEIYPLTFAVGALLGIGLGVARLLPDGISPPSWMWPWFLIIAAHSAIDLFHEFSIPSTRLDDLVNHLDEAAEMLVALSALTYVLVKRTADRPAAIDRWGRAAT